MSDKITAVVLLVVFAIAISAMLAAPVMWLWNGCLVPAVDGVHRIGWLQSWGLMILAGMLFKNHQVKVNSK